MTFSNLASRAVDHHGKFSARDGTAVEYLTVHHWAGTSGGDTRLLNPSEQVSATYILYGSGELVGQVPEEYRPWTSGSWAADAPAVTVETQNSENGGDWPVSDAAVKTLARLAADLCKRYGWGRLDRNRVRGHREFASTACPGPYLWARLDHIVAQGNQILDEGEDDMFTDEDRELLTSVKRALFDIKIDDFGKRPGGIGREVHRLRDSQFLKNETSFGTPGGTLATLKVVLEQQALIMAKLGIEPVSE